MKMKTNAFLYTLFGIGLGASALTGNTMQVTVDSFQQPSGANPFAGFTPTVDVRYGELFSLVPDHENVATHIFIEGLVPLASGSNQILSSYYRAYQLPSRQLQDVGSIYLKATPNAGLAANAVASPVFGLVRRNGAWSNYTSLFPVAEIAGASGLSTYTGSEQSGGVFNISIERNGQSFTGSVPYSVLDSETIQLNSALSIGGFTYRPSLLVRDGDRFFGMLESLSASLNYDAALLTIQITDLPDTDGDGIPDIVDPEILGTGETGIMLIPGDWIYNTTFGWLYGIQNTTWANSNYMGFIHVADYNGVDRWIYHYLHGWMWYELGTHNGPSGMWLWSLEYEWINTRESWNGFFYIDQLYDGNRWGWFGSTELFPEVQ
jgi:hypothetical protein